MANKRAIWLENSLNMRTFNHNRDIYPNFPNIQTPSDLGSSYASRHRRPSSLKRRKDLKGTNCDEKGNCPRFTIPNALVPHPDPGAAQTLVPVGPCNSPRADPPPCQPSQRRGMGASQRRSLATRKEAPMRRDITMVRVSMNPFKGHSGLFV